MRRFAEHFLANLFLSVLVGGAVETLRENSPTLYYVVAAIAAAVAILQS
jgi:hypothetical protein